MRQHGIYAQRKSSYKVTTQSNHSFPVAANKLNRQFQVSRPNAVWSSDITYIATAEGWLYLAVVMDLYSRQIIGWSMQLTLQRQLVLDALKMALQRRQPGQSLLHHSDRGSQYASHDYQSLLARYGIEPSMSRRGNCYDNSPVESFFASLKKECVRARVYKSRYQAKSALFDYIEVFYNRQRLHSSLGYHSPIEFERLASVS
jgi:transposase InsO family protein